MKFSTAFFATAAFLTSVPGFGLAAPTNSQRQAPSIEDIANAANLWAQDTGKVSQFLNIASTLSGSNFKDQAATALMSENNELTQKQVLDNALGSNPSVQAANDILVEQGTFANVVSLLQDMASNGASRVGDVETINNIRCTYVLPAIDAYFAAAAEVIQNGVQLEAVRPTACQ